MLPILIRRTGAIRGVAMVGSGAVRLIDPIERAGAVYTTRIMHLQQHGTDGEAPSYVVLNGIGNTGADGLVIDRYWRENVRSVRLVISEHRAGGSGDVLTGILSGLLARGHAPQDACMSVVFLHGLAGDRAEQALGAETIGADDIVAFLPARGSRRSTTRSDPLSCLYLPAARWLFL